MRPARKSTLNIRGFTLVELIAVLVILGIVAAIGSSFITSAVDSYDKSEKRAKLVSRGRASIEQMTRQLRNALPNAVRVSGSGNCLEFLPVTAGANYLGVLPDQQNGAAATSNISTSPFSLGLGLARHAVVGALSTSEVYSNGNPAARATIGSVDTGSPPGITLIAPHVFIRGSVSQRVFLTDNPKRFCLIGTDLVQYEGYGLDTGNLDDSNPGGESLLLAQNVSSPGVAFSLSPGSEDRNTAINISLIYSERGEQVLLNNQVLLRNVP